MVTKTFEKILRRYGHCFQRRLQVEVEVRRQSATGRRRKKNEVALCQKAHADVVSLDEAALAENEAKAEAFTLRPTHTPFPHPAPYFG